MPANVPFQLLLPMQWSRVITDRFNAPRTYAFAPGKLQKHEGIDFAPTQRATGPLHVLASQRGLVSRVAYSAQGYGNYVRIDHDWGDQRYVTWYGHMSSTSVNEGDYVAAGQIIGIAGSTGFSTGTHLHLTLQHIGHGLANYVVDDVVDPEPFLADALPAFDEASWVADVTIQDGTIVRPGQNYTKIWRLRNTGTRPWGSGFTFALFSGQRMNAPDSIPLPPAQPGQTVDVSINLRAPDTNGVHRSTWKPRDPAANWFDYAQWVEIVVQPSTPPPPVTLASELGWVADVTIPDGTTFRPGESFLKTWRVRNKGRSTWGDGFRLAFFSGERMSGPTSVPLPAAAPNQEVEVSVRLTAPPSPGVYRSTWKPQSPDGRFFEHEQWAEIRVAGQPLVNEASLIADGFTVRPGETFIKTWRVRNVGGTAWSSAYTLVFGSGERMNAPQDVALSPASSGEEVIIALTLTAPATPGYHRGTWRLRGERGDLFGPELNAAVFVIQS